MANNFWIDLPFTSGGGGGGGGTGTVTSVGLLDASTGSIFGITGSPITTAGNFTITFPNPATSGNVLTSDGTTWKSLPISGSGGGTVTSVGLVDQDTSNLFKITGSPVTVTGNIGLSFQPTSATFVLAGPASSGSIPSFRGLVASDLPQVNLATTAVTGILPVIHGGTSTTALTLNNVLLGNSTNAPQTVAPGTSGNVLTSNGVTWTSSTPTGGSGSGTVTSVALSDTDSTNIFNITGSPITTSGTLGIGFQPSSANFVLAGPATSAAIPSFRKLAQSDIPAPSLASTGFGGVTGTLPVINGGTSLSLLTLNSVFLGNGTNPPNFVAPGTSGNVLTSNGITWTSSTPTSGGGGGSGTVTSVALSDTDSTNIFNITGSPITTSGTLGIGFQPTSAGFFLGGPASSAAIPTFRKHVVLEG